MRTVRPISQRVAAGYTVAPDQARHERAATLTTTGPAEVPQIGWVGGINEL